MPRSRVTRGCKERKQRWNTAPPLPASPTLTTRAGTPASSAVWRRFSRPPLQSPLRHQPPELQSQLPNLLPGGSERAGGQCVALHCRANPGFSFSGKVLFWRESPGFWWQLAPSPALYIALGIVAYILSQCCLQWQYNIVTASVTKYSPSPRTHVTLWHLIAPCIAGILSQLLSRNCQLLPHST